MPLVGIALLFYPLFCMCGQHPREQGGAFGRETHWHVGVSCIIYPYPPVGRTLALCNKRPNLAEHLINAVHFAK